MNAQLLLLLFLAGPFYGSTRASPTEIPADLDSATLIDLINLITVVPTHEDIITGPTDPQPEAVPAEASTESAVELPTESVMEQATDGVTNSTEAESTIATAPKTEASVVAETTTPTAAPSSPSATQELETQAGVTENSKAEPGDEVVVEEDGLSSGQVVGIVIGALVAVVFVIAVVIALVRRMGKYSP